MYSELSVRRLTRMDRKRRHGKTRAGYFPICKGRMLPQVFPKRIDRGYTSIGGGSLF
jgi:hypothetical protein